MVLSNHDVHMEHKDKWNSTHPLHHKNNKQLSMTDPTDGLTYSTQADLTHAISTSFEQYKCTKS